MAESGKTGGGERRGILCAGNWIIDHVKTIDVWPQEDTLANILAEESGTGGSAYNVLVDLARFKLGIPLAALGLVGDDSDGRSILEDCGRRGIETRLLRTVAEAPTSYTDVMTVRSTARRTFFHNRGANRLLAPAHFPIPEITSRVANLGYLLLLDGMDAADSEYGTAAARVLAGLRAAGILTSIDVVSEDSDRFARVVTPALPHADYCTINEIEAGRTTGHQLRVNGKLDRRAMAASARELLERGVKRRVVIHAPELAYALDRSGEKHWQPAHLVPQGEIAGTAGAGDAFLAGVLVGIHEGWPIERSLRFANAAAVSCLRHPTTTGGVADAEEIWRIAERLPLRPLEG
jgi:sugar/nucleoside kinase (ribokinase family)